MLRFREGDESAFEELVRRNTHKVHALVYRFLGGPHHVEDLTQEVFLRIYKTAERYRPAAKFSTWLYRIVANLSFNVMRARQRSPIYQFGQSGGEDDDGLERHIRDKRAADPYDSLGVDELREQIAQAVSKLPENQRAAVILHQYEHKGYEEISQVLECSTMAVKSLLSRARENLRYALRKYLRE
jgi:RNA polymerase sigma-70 factor (ECF subfamily)